MGSVHSEWMLQASRSRCRVDAMCKSVGDNATAARADSTEVQVCVAVRGYPVKIWPRPRTLLAGTAVADGLFK